MEVLEGKKTYILGIALICYAIGGYIAGKVDANTAIQEIGIGLGFIFVRRGISRTT